MAVVFRILAMSGSGGNLMDKQKFRSADILVSFFIILIGVGIIVMSVLLMSDNPDRRFYVSNGFLPLLFGIVMVILSGIVIAIAIRERGSLSLFTPKKIWAAIKSSEGINTLFILGWIAFYLWVFLGLLPYIMASFIFLIVLFRVYYRKNIILETVLAIGFSSMVTYLFGTVVNIPLP
jgi:hypothetical protein